MQKPANLWKQAASREQGFTLADLLQLNLDDEPEGASRADQALVIEILVGPERVAGPASFARFKEHAL